MNGCATCPENGASHKCKPCRKAYKTQWARYAYERNPEKYLRKQKTYRATNPERRRETQEKACAKFYGNPANKGKYVERQAAWRAANTERLTRGKAAWYARLPPEKMREISRLKNHVRRARKNSAEGRFTAKEWNAKKEEHGGLCASCKQPRPLTIDHIVPISRGGSNWISNIQPLCRSCNSRKHTKLPEEPAA